MILFGQTVVPTPSTIYNHVYKWTNRRISIPGMSLNDVRNGAGNLHPQDKTCPATRLAKRILHVAYGVGSDATMAGPSLTQASLLLSPSGEASVTLHLENAAGLKLLPAKHCDVVRPFPQGNDNCCDMPGGLLVLNATLADGTSVWLNGTASVVGSTVVGLWRAPFYDQATGIKLAATTIQHAHTLEYASAAGPKCAIVNSAEMPMAPFRVAL